LEKESVTAKKSAKQRPLAERVQALKTEVEAGIDRLAEERRPKGPNGLPAGSLRLMWMGKGGNLFDAYLLAAKEGNVPAGK
jgi:hypothetical protein